MLPQGNQHHNYLLKTYADANPNIHYLVRNDVPAKSWLMSWHTYKAPPRRN